MAKNQLDKLVDLKSMTKAEAKVLIATDVLAAIKAKRLNVESGSYCELEFETSGIPDYDASLRDAMPKMKRCNVCAIGALFVANVARVNKFNISIYSDGYAGVDDSQMLEKLRPYFGKVELRTIEAAFEGRAIECEREIGKDVLGKCRKFYCRYSDFEKRLQAICRNIVRHDGTFTP